MLTCTSWKRGVAASGLVVAMTVLAGAGAPLEFVKTNTFQNLAPSPSKFMGHYLSVDDAGAMALSTAATQEASGAFWELKKTFWKERGYVSHNIIQRGNSKHNALFLSLDAKTGALTLQKFEGPTSRWLVRYAGKYQGWDAYYIQNLAETGTTDMQFLAIDEATGEVKLSAKPTPGAHWHMARPSDLPAESLY